MLLLLADYFDYAATPISRAFRCRQFRCERQRRFGCALPRRRCDDLAMLAAAAAMNR